MKEEIELNSKLTITFKQLVDLGEEMGFEGTEWEKVKTSMDLNKLNNYLDKCIKKSNDKFSTNDFFCGAGGMGLGFKNAGFKLNGAWDFDKYAVESYRNNISSNVKQMDISQMKWNEVPQSDVWTFGFPCQDISIAGKQAGIIKGKTRSGLFYEIMRLLEETEQNDYSRLPKVILAENVKQLKKYLPVLEEEYATRGYKMYYALYNSKYWGVPQNRERYFVVGIHESISHPFIFSEQRSNKVLKLIDCLEKEVEEKYYIDKPLEIFDKMKGSVIGQLQMKGNDCIRRVYDTGQVAPTLTTMQGGHRQPKIAELIQVGNLKRDGYHDFSNRVYDSEGIARTLMGSGGNNQDRTGMYIVGEQIVRVRRLTPRECARLQGFPDTYEQVVSDSQFYKQMGNAVTVKVSQAIAEQIKSFLINYK